jgi:hypothetical protein
MIESPLLQKLFATSRQQAILAVLKARFGTLPPDLTKHLQDILDEKKLRQLILLAALCPDIQAFREALLS